jgi:hypothetical protein
LRVNGRPPNSLKDLNANLKMKTTVEGVGVHSLTHNTAGVRRAYWNFGMGIKTSNKWVNYSYGSTQSKQEVG